MNILQYSPDEVREYRKSLRSTFDKIQAYYIVGEKISLTAKQEEQRLRYEETYTFLIKYKTRDRVKNLLCKKFNCSRAEAYRNISETLRLFGNVNESSRKGLRHLLTESCLRMLNKAETSGLYCEYNATLANLIKMNGLDNFEEIEEDPDKYAPCTIIISTDPATLEQQALDMVADIEDIDFVEELDDVESEENLL